MFKREAPGMCPVCSMVNPALLKTLLRRSTHAVPIRPQKANVHPAVPNSDTLVGASVTVYQNHIDQRSPIFLEATTIYSTTVPGRDILSRLMANVIFSGC